MPFVFTVSPDFSPRKAPGWYVFNTWLQRVLNDSVHLELYDSFASQRAAMAADRLDLIYANPFDASTLLRELGFSPVAAPAGRSDEALIVVPAASAVRRPSDLRPGSRLASTDDPDVNLMGELLLEPADLRVGDFVAERRNSYVLVAKDLLQGAADVAFFLDAAFEELSPMVRVDLRIVARSRIQVIRHVLLSGRRLASRREALVEALRGMAAEARGRELLASLGIEGWESLDQEAVEFMIDLIDTLCARPA